MTEEEFIYHQKGYAWGARWGKVDQVVRALAEYNGCTVNKIDGMSHFFHRIVFFDVSGPKENTDAFKKAIEGWRLP